MLRLRTLGGISLESDAGALGAAAVQRRRLAILALLATSRDRGVSRDKLLAYLWPASDADKTRFAGISDDAVKIRGESS